MRNMNYKKDKLAELNKLEEKLLKLNYPENKNYTGKYNGNEFRILLDSTGQRISSREYIDEIIKVVDSVYEGKPCAIYNLNNGDTVVEFEKYPILRYKALKNKEKKGEIKNLRELVLS